MTDPKKNRSLVLHQASGEFQVAKPSFAANYESPKLPADYNFEAALCQAIGELQLAGFWGVGVFVCQVFLLHFVFLWCRGWVLCIFIKNRYFRYAFIRKPLFSLLSVAEPCSHQKKRDHLATHATPSPHRFGGHLATKFRGHLDTEFNFKDSSFRLQTSSGSPYIPNTPPHLAIPVPHIF